MSECQHSNTKIRGSSRRSGDDKITITSVICDDCKDVVDVSTDIDRDFYKPPPDS